MVLDVAVIQNADLSEYKSNDYLNNNDLITFGEAKHMSAFAELLASFLGIVHEISPDNLKKSVRIPGVNRNISHPPPFLYVSGHLYRTAKGILESIEERGFDIDICDSSTGLKFGMKLPTKPPEKPIKNKVLAIEEDERFKEELQR